MTSSALTLPRHSALRRDAGHLASAMGMSMALGLVGRLILPRALGPEAYGTLRLAEASADMLFVTLGLGLDALLRRDIAQHPAVLAARLWPVVLLRATVGFAGAALGAVIFGMTATPLLTATFAVLAIGQTAAAVTQAVQAAEQAIGRGPAVARELAVVKVLWLLGILAVVRVAPLVFVVAVVTAVMDLARASLLLRRMARVAPRPSAWDLAGLRLLVVAAVPFAVNALAHGLYARFGLWRIGALQGAAEAGRYGAALQLGGVALAAIPLLGAVVLPALSRDPANAVAVVHRLLRMLCGILAPSSAVAVALAPWWLPILLGSSFMPVLGALPAVAATVVLTYVASLLAFALIARGAVRTVAAISLLGLVVSALCTWQLVTPGATGNGAATRGAALAALLTEAVVAAALALAWWRAVRPPRSPRLRSAGTSFLAMVLAVTLVGCAPTIAATPLAEWQAPVVEPAPEPDRLAPGDLVFVQVWKAEQLTTRQRVRSDGTLSLFFLGDLSVAGRTPSEVADTIAAGLVDVLLAPQVSVVLEERAASVVTVLGEVARPGTHAVRRDVTLLEALALAGGLTEFARRDGLMVLRQGTPVARVRVDFRDVLQGLDAERGLRLRPGDALIVP